MNKFIRKCFRHGILGMATDISGGGSGGTADSDFAEKSLSEAETGHTFALIGLAGGHRLRERISAIGLNSGAVFKVISNSGHGPVGVEVRGARIGIGRGMADKIRVREIAHSD